METKALATVQKYEMLPRGCTVVLGLSGGADSIALADFLDKIQQPFGFVLTAAHLNHGLRGEEADRDEHFVSAFCRERKIPLTIRRMAVRQEAAKHGESEEACGRRLRYQFFQELAGACQHGIVATAHTFSDSMETVLFHMARGCGLHGLCGIPAVRGNIIRPLIDCTREEIEAYCRKYSLPFMTDSSNSSAKYARNRLRMDAIPALRSVNPELSQSFHRMVTSLWEDEQYLSESAEKALTQAKVSQGYLISALEGLPAPLLNRAIMALVKEKTGDSADFQTVGRIRGILSGGSTQISGGFTVRARKGVLEFPSSSVSGLPFPVFLSEGVNNIPSGKLKVSVYEHKKLFISQNVNKNLLTNCIECDKIIGKMTVRSRLPGDRYRPLFRHCTKTLKQLFNEAGIPPEKRGGIPVVCDDEGILWVAGFGVASRASVEEGKRMLYLEYVENCVQTEEAPLF